jgi:membrane-bound ClpP family serine protease
MWVVAGVLLGLVVLGGLVGLHSGPHVHGAAGAIGVVAAAWLLVMVAEGHSAPVLWVLFGADLALSSGLGVMAWSGLRHPAAGRGDGAAIETIEAAEGVAVGDLAPKGVVRVRGEEWSAVSLNGPVPSGTAVQVIRVRGVHLEVWGERPAAVLVEPGPRPDGVNADRKERMP